MAREPQTDLPAVSARRPGIAAQTAQAARQRQASGGAVAWNAAERELVDGLHGRSALRRAAVPGLNDSG